MRGEHRRPASGPAGGTRPGRRTWPAFVGAFALFFIVIGLWSLSTPLLGGADEPVHVIKAAAVARGQLTGRLIGGSGGPNGYERVPSFYASVGGTPICYAARPTVSASCATTPAGGSNLVDVEVYNARYPPLYYAIVGLPTLVTASVTGLDLMRLVSAALSALFLALAFWAVVKWSRSRFLLAGVLVAATPAALFFGGVVNPSGLEITVAICVWTAGLVLVLEHLDDPPPGLVALVAASTGVELLLRSLSPLWIALIGVALLAVADWTRLRGFVRRRSVLFGLGAIVACGVVAAAWIFGEHALNVLPPRKAYPPSVPRSKILSDAFDRTSMYWDQMISTVDWLQVNSPTFVGVAWAGLLGFLCIFAGAVSNLRRAVVLALLIVAVVVIPVVIPFTQARHVSLVWQGKDTMPLAVGVPLLAAALIDRAFRGRRGGLRDPEPAVASALGGRTRRMVGIVAAVAALGELVTFWGMLRRNAVGTLGPNLDIFHSSWRPPLGVAGLLVLEAAGVAALAVWVTVWAGAPVPVRPVADETPLAVETPVREAADVPGAHGA
jgi:hypothetical protein